MRVTDIPVSVTKRKITQEISKDIKEIILSRTQNTHLFLIHMKHFPRYSNHGSQNNLNKC